jgi:hypothetical protein
VAFSAIIALNYFLALHMHRQGIKPGREFLKFYLKWCAGLIVLSTAAFGYFLWPSIWDILLPAAFMTFGAVVDYGLILFFLRPSRSQETSAAERTADGKALSNERTKLLANALDRASTACFTVGVATPTAGYLLNVSEIASRVEVGALALLCFGWLTGAISLHLAARHVLGGLE